MKTEQGSRLPPQLLGTIAVVESGRREPGSGTMVPWPWTINVGGVGYYYGNRLEAVAATKWFMATGVQSIDVGCLQINLMFHPHAFSSLDEAFDPGSNVRYAAAFLGHLFREFSTWPKATAAYHSRTPELGAEYARRVMAAWPLSKQYGALPTATLFYAPIVDDKFYTPEFAARIRRNAADRASRDAISRKSGLRQGESLVFSSGNGVARFKYVLKN